MYFSKDDIEQSTPALPISSLIEELKKRHGEDRYNAEYKNCMERADDNFDGLITVDELVKVIEMMHDTKKENTGLKKVLTLGVVVLLLVLVSIFGLVFAVVQLTKEISTGTSDNPNALISESTGLIVDTHPSDGGGIYLEMAAFTEPVNITFPGFGKTQECVGQVPVSDINAHYKQFTTGGSAMTIRHVDYTEEQQPVVYTVIPADTLSVTGFGADENAKLQAYEGTQAIIETQVVFGDNNGRKRRMTAATRMLEMYATPGGKGEGSEELEEKRKRNDVTATPPQGSNEIDNGKNGQASQGKRRRRLVEGELATVADYMEGFADKSIVLTFTKDDGLTEDVYFVCRGDAAIAVN